MKRLVMRKGQFYEQCTYIQHYNYFHIPGKTPTSFVCQPRLGLRLDQIIVSIIIQSFSNTQIPHIIIYQNEFQIGISFMRGCKDIRIKRDVRTRR